MSEYAIDVVEISLPESVAVQQAAEVTQWMLASGVIEPNVDRDDLWRPSEYRAGPQVLRAAPDFDSPYYRDGAYSGVDIIAGRRLYHPYETTNRRTVPPAERRSLATFTLISSRPGC